MPVSLPAPGRVLCSAMRRPLDSLKTETGQNTAGEVALGTVWGLTLTPQEGFCGEIQPPSATAWIAPEDPEGSARLREFH